MGRGGYGQAWLWVGIMAMLCHAALCSNFKAWANPFKIHILVSVKKVLKLNLDEHYKEILTAKNCRHNEALMLSLYLN